MRLKSLIKPYVLSCLDILGINWTLRKLSKTPVVFFWHGVSETPDPIVEGESFSVDLFIKQIEFIERNYEIISIDEFYIRYKNGTFTNREAVLTFDDGYKNNLTTAAPILKKHGLPFTVFVSAQNINNQERFYILVPRMIIIGGELDEVSIPSMKYHRLLSTLQERIECAHEIEYKIKYYSHEEAKKIASDLIDNFGQDSFETLCQRYRNGELLAWEDVRKLISQYDCTIGSHCMDHCICHSNQPLSTVEWQLSESKTLIEKETGRECIYFAYPNGDYTEETNKLVGKYYKMGFSTKETPIQAGISVPESIGRIGVPLTLIDLKFLLSKLALRQMFNSRLRFCGLI